MRTNKIKFDPETLDRIGDTILGSSGPRAIRLEEEGSGVAVVFVARQPDARAVLMDDKLYSVAHYQKLFTAASRPGAGMLLQPEGDQRRERYAILKAACERSPWFVHRTFDAADMPDDPLRALSREIVTDVLDSISGRPEPRFDIIGEFGSFVPYVVARRIFGVEGDAGFDAAGWAIASARLGEPAAANAETADYQRQFVRSLFSFAQLFGNFDGRDNFISGLGQWANTEIARAYTACMARAQERLRRRAPPANPSLLEALLLVREQFEGVADDVYRNHIVYLLLELAGTAMVVPQLGFAEIMRNLHKEDALPERLALLRPSVSRAWLDESLRFAPPAKFLLRTATSDHALCGVKVRRDNYVCALIGKAGMDSGVFTNPAEFRLDRREEDYLHFSAWGGPHKCFGRRIAHAILESMFEGLARLDGLEFAGEPQLFQGSPGSLMARFRRSTRRRFGPAAWRLGGETR